MFVPTTFFLQKLLAQLIDHAVAGPFSGVLDGTYVGLGQTPTGTLQPNQGMSAITEANYDGYARVPVTWKGPYVNPSGSSTIQSDGSYFVPTDSTVQNTITSMFVADALTAGNLLLSMVLPNGPIFMTGPQTAFSLSLLFQLQATNNFGTALVIQ